MTNKSCHDAVEFEIYHANLCLLNSQIIAIEYHTIRNDSIFHEKSYRINFELSYNITKFAF